MRESHRSWPYKIGRLSKKGDSSSSYPVERTAAAKIPNRDWLDGISSCPAQEMMFDKMDSSVKERKCNGGK